MTELTLGDFKRILNYLIDNNHKLIDNGDTQISICIEGESGLGKTAVIEQVAKERGMTLTKINLAQLEEPAELVGFPFKEYKVIDNGKEMWVSADILHHMNCNFITTNESRMSYATPAWLPRKFNENGTMLVLDDFSRANSLLIQAIMEIINTGSYISWKLPKYTTIVLSSNPDNGTYSVTGLDSAVKSRMITFSAKFDINEWAHWAEMFGIDGRAINFAMLYSAEIFEPKNGVIIANARSYTTFCKAISGIKNWSDENSLAMILEIASGCFLENDNILGTLFTSYINNNLDKLISPEEIISGSWDSVCKKIENCVYKNDNYRADIANILGTRLMNYCDKYLGTKKLDSKIVMERLDAFITCDKQLFTQDILYNIIKTLCKNHVVQTNKWFLNNNIRRIAL